MDMNQARRLRAGWLAFACMLAGASAQASICKPKGPQPAGAILASWAEHRGHRTASGEIYDERQLTAAHPALPLQSIIRIRNLKNGRIVKVRINDRGPGYERGIDVSEAAADVLGMRQCGLAQVLILAAR